VPVARFTVPLFWFTRQQHGLKISNTCFLEVAEPIGQLFLILYPQLAITLFRTQS